MKEEWKVFIRGVEGRGNEIIKILTDLGAENNSEWTDKYMSSCYIYFINHKGNISSASINSESAKIIMDNYREIKLPKQWNDGDILINKDKTDYKVFLKYDSDSDTTFYAYNVSICVNGIITKCLGSIWHGDMLLCYREDYYLATSKEIEQFHNILHKAHKEWDAEKKQLVTYRWKPGMGEIYWVVFANSNIVPYKWYNDSIDNNYFDFGNCFKTKEEAEAMVEKIIKLLKGEQL